MIPVRIPAVWWRSLSAAELRALHEDDGLLNHGQCVRLWELLGLPGVAPRSMTVVVEAAEVERYAAELVAEKRRRWRKA